MQRFYLNGDSLLLIMAESSGPADKNDRLLIQNSKQPWESL